MILISSVNFTFVSLFRLMISARYRHSYPDWATYESGFAGYQIGEHYSLGAYYRWREDCLDRKPEHPVPDVKFPWYQRKSKECHGMLGGFALCSCSLFFVRLKLSLGGKFRPLFIGRLIDLLIFNIQEAPLSTWKLTGKSIRWFFDWLVDRKTCAVAVCFVANRFPVVEGGQ